MKEVFVTRTALPPFEEFCDEIRPLWESHVLTNSGALHERFRERLESGLDCPHVVLFANGHLALEAALSALRLPAGAEVVTTPFTFVSTVHAIVRCGLRPVFCDVLEEDGTLDPGRLEERVGPRTAAILPVHVFGNVCDVERIGAVAERHSLKVLYDAAHAFGVRYRGVPAVRFGDAAVLSFHATKVFSTAEGGAVCCPDASMVQALEDSRNFGIRDEEHCAAVGGNAKMNELQAALGLCNLRRVGQEISARQAHVAHYCARLEGRPGLRRLAPRPGVEHNGAYFPLVFESKALRDAVCGRLRERGIRARKYFYPLVSDLECYAGTPFAAGAGVPVARRLSDGVLCLPVYGELDPDEVDRICDGVLGI